MDGRVYEYGAKPPTAGGERVWEQSRLAHRYRNRLCELELARRAAAEQVLRSHCPDLAEMHARVDALAAELEACRDRIRGDNQRIRGRAASPDRDRAAQLKADLRDARAALKIRRAEAWADGSLRADLDAVDNAHVAEVKTARAASGLYWGNYLRIEQAAASMRKGAPPIYHRFTGKACATVQIQGGMSLADALAGSDPRFRLEPWQPSGPIAADPQSRRSGRGGWMLAHVRIGSTGRRRQPTWTTAPVRLHRLPPADAQIKWVHLRSRRIGTRQVWRLQLVLASAGGFAPADRAATGCVGVDLGWRLLEDGSLRVAYWVGSDGAEGQLALSAYDLQRWDKAEQLRSIRDRAFDDIRGRLLAWLAVAKDVPDWLRERTATLPLWRSCGRLAAVALAWRDARFAGDEEEYAAVEAWRAQDRHLYDWEASQIAKAMAWRTDLYRRFAATLSRRYATVALEDIDYKNLGRRPAAESKDVVYASRHRQLASPGKLADALRQRFAARADVPAMNTTRRCHSCGHIESFDAAAELVHTCGGCGAEWDQDASAARNLLASASGEVVDDLPGVARE